MGRLRLKEKARRRAIAYSMALLLAIVNDILDLAGLGAPLPEAVVDGLLAIAIISSLPERRLIDVLGAITDIITGIDIAPIWSAYVLYRMKKVSRRRAYTRQRTSRT